ncbi:hypothetical protein Tco_0483887 [Tanacetum coccineum]
MGLLRSVNRALGLIRHRDRAPIRLALKQCSDWAESWSLPTLLEVRQFVQNDGDCLEDERAVSLPSAKVSFLIGNSKNEVGTCLRVFSLLLDDITCLVKKAILRELPNGARSDLNKTFVAFKFHNLVPHLSCNKSEAKSSDAEGDEDMNDANETLKSAAGGKKDLALRRRELLVDSGLAEVPIVNYVVFWG